MVFEKACLLGSCLGFWKVFYWDNSLAFDLGYYLELSLDANLVECLETDLESKMVVEKALLLVSCSVF